jgi:hypothetical protein
MGADAPRGRDRDSRGGALALLGLEAESGVAGERWAEQKGSRRARALGAGQRVGGEVRDAEAEGIAGDFHCG